MLFFMIKAQMYNCLNLLPREIVYYAAAIILELNSTIFHKTV